MSGKTKLRSKTAGLHISGGTVCHYYPLDETGISKIKDFLIETCS